MSQLTQTELMRLVTYDPNTGLFVNKIFRNVKAKAGDIAGTRTTDGYLAIQISGKKYQAHRLAWLYMTGDWPEHEIDHVNRLRDDNRWRNLRVVTRMENSHNTGKHAKSISGRKGVAWHSRAQKWQVQLRVNHVSHYIGMYANLDDAVRARAEAEQRLYGAKYANARI